MKKKITWVVSCLMALSLLIALIIGCAGPKVDTGEPVIPPLTLTATSVTAIPTIDGDASDEAWASAKTLGAGILRMKAVHTTNELALLMTWDDRDLSINTRGSWNWDPEIDKWYTTGSNVTWESFTGRRHPEWLCVAFDISSKMKYQGCNAFCHDGHHNTEVNGEYVDAWILLGKHGFGPKYYEGGGWQLGVDGVTQSGSIVFDKADPIDSHQLIAGTVNFVGYADDKIIVSPDDPDYPKVDTPAAQYCIKCHSEVGAPDLTTIEGRTFGDEGEIMYFANLNTSHTAPLYMEKNPTNFADCMVLTQKEIDDGEAVAVDGLSASEMDTCWDNYKALNGVVPELALKTPTGSQADVRVAATWSDGLWTLEAKRNLVTGYNEDVQYDDLTKNYYFTISLYNHTDLLVPMFGVVPAVLKFE